MFLSVCPRYTPFVERRQQKAAGGNRHLQLGKKASRKQENHACG